jgi:hypothetical protein
MLLMAVSYVVHPWLIKRVADAPSRPRSLIVFYFVNTVLATILAIVSEASFNTMVLWVVILGVANAFACYCHWRAIAISLSKTSIFTQVDDLIAISMGYIVLGETALVTPTMAFGIFIVMGSAFLFSLDNWRIKRVSDRGNGGWGIITWVLIYSIIWGIDMFLMRYFSVTFGMSLPTFVVGFYVGSLIGAVLVLLISNADEVGNPLTMAQKKNAALPAITAFACTVLHVWVKQLVPITVSQPLLQAAEMIFPTLIGLYVFKERKNLTANEKIIMLITAVGGVLIISSY